MLVGAHDGGVDDQVLKIRIGGHRLEHPAPDTLLAPSAEAAEDAVPVAERTGKVTPRRTGPDDPQHTFHEHPVVAPGRALLIGMTDDQTRHPLPLSVAQHQTFLHTQDCLPKSSLESCFNSSGNPQSPQNLGSGALVGKKIAEVPWGIYASRAFVQRHGSPSDPQDIQRFAVIELIDELEKLPAVRWIKSRAPKARIAARCANVPSAHLAVKSGAGLAPLPVVYAGKDADLVNLLGSIPELNYPMFLVAHQDVRSNPRVNAFFDFCLHELRPVLLRGTMRPRNSDIINAPLEASRRHQ